MWKQPDTEHNHNKHLYSMFNIMIFIFNINFLSSKQPMSFTTV